MVLQEVVAASTTAAAAKEDEDDVSDKGSESDEGEANKDSPSERDEDSDKQSDTEVDEMAGDDEEVRTLYMLLLTCKSGMIHVSDPSLCPPTFAVLGVGGVAAEHPAARESPARNQVKGDAPRVQSLLPRREAGVVVALHRRPQRSDPCLHALPRLHAKGHRRGEILLVFL